MKKKIVYFIFVFMLGLTIGTYVLNRYKALNYEETSDSNTVYMLNYADFNSYDDMVNSIVDVDQYIYIDDGSKYKTYLAIAKTKENAQKVKNIYEEKNLSIKKVSIDNLEFLQNLNEYEKLLDASSDKQAILTIEKQILSCYEKMVANE